MPSSTPTVGIWEQRGESLRLPLEHTFALTGWSLDGGQRVAAVRIYVDGSLLGSAHLGVSRPDVVSAFADPVDEDCGWSFDLDPADLSPSLAHTVNIRTMTGDGRVTDLGTALLNFAEGEPHEFVPSTGPDSIFLDEPESGVLIDESTVLVCGWVKPGDYDLDSVAIEVDGATIGAARCFVPRPDVSKNYDDPLNYFVGFQYHWTPVSRHGESTVTAVAMTTTGQHFSSKSHSVTVDIDSEVEAAPKLGFFSATADNPAIREPKPDAKRRILVATHALSVGGGQLWLTDLLAQLRSEPDLDLSVMAMEDGPLRKDLENSGIEVHLTAGPPDGSAERYECRVQELSYILRGCEYDAVLCNTIGTFFIADAARRVQIPYITAIHEHFDLTEWWPYRDGRAPGGYAFECFRETLRSAYRLVFEANATRELYRSMLDTDNGVVVYYGIDTERIDRYIELNPRTRVRHELGITDQATVIMNIGTFEARKAQAALIDVFQRVAVRHPDAELLLVGADKDEYSDAIRDLVGRQRLNRRIRLAPVSLDVYQFYRAADLLVSASDIESMPRSFMEAMAFCTPIVTTDVAGCKELVLDSVTGWTTPPRTTQGLEIALERALSQPTTWGHFAAKGRELLEQRHSSAAHGARIAEILRDAVTSRSA